MRSLRSKAVCWLPIWNRGYERHGLEHVVLATGCAESALLAIAEDGEPFRLSYRLAWDQRGRIRQADLEIRKDLERQANLLKHRINFVDAQALWNDPSLLEVPAKTEDEPRYLMIGLISETHWSAVITYRGSNVRLISVRRSRTEEVALYES